MGVKLTKSFQENEALNQLKLLLSLNNVIQSRTIDLVRIFCKKLSQISKLVPLNFILSLTKQPMLKIAFN